MVERSPYPPRAKWFHAGENPFPSSRITRENYPSEAQLWDLVAQQEVRRAGLNPEDATVKQRVERLLGGVLSDMHSLDRSGQEHFRLPSGVRAGDYGVIARFSNPGTYDIPFKNSDNGKFPQVWAHGMDRRANDAAAMAAIRLLETVPGVEIAATPNLQLLTGDDLGLEKNRGLIRQGMKNLGIKFFYAGLPEETRAIERVIHTPSSYIPPDLVVTESQQESNTISQLEAFGKFLNKNTALLNKRVMIVGFAAHLTRLMRLAGTLDVFPDWVPVDLALLPTPQAGLGLMVEGNQPSMVTQETKGSLYRILKKEAAESMKMPNLLGNPWLYEDVS